MQRQNSLNLVDRGLMADRVKSQSFVADLAV